MNLDTVVAISEAVGAVAVVVSLVYVGVQIRQNTISQNALMHQQFVDSQNETNRIIADDNQISEIIERANHGLQNLTPEEIRKLSYTIFCFFNLWHVAVENHRRGMLEMEVLEEWERGYRFALQNEKSMLLIWETLRPVYSEAFQSRVDKVITSVAENAA